MQQATKTKLHNDVNPVITDADEYLANKHLPYVQQTRLYLNKTLLEINHRASGLATAGLWKWLLRRAASIRVRC